MAMPTRLVGWAREPARIERAGSSSLGLVLAVLFRISSQKGNLMSKMHMALGFAAIVSLGGGIAAPSQVFAAAKDYRFEVVGAPVKSGKATLIKVRLLHVPDGKSVAGAIIIQAKLDMEPEGMASMTAAAKATAAPEPGVYQISAEPEMAGNWALHLSAKVQGEAGTVSGTVTVPIGK